MKIVKVMIQKCLKINRTQVQCFSVCPSRALRKNQNVIAANACLKAFSKNAHRRWFKLKA
jgi:hypothetical protein